MRNWPARYRILGGACLVFAMFALLAHYRLLRPRRLEVQQMEESIAQTSGQIIDRNWPVDPNALTQLRRETQFRLNRLEESLEKLRLRATATFAAPISRKFGREASEDSEQFINYVTRLDYQEYYAEIVGKWQNANIRLHPQVLNLDEDAISPHIYRLILQLWTVDAVLETLLANELTPVLDRFTLPANPQARENDQPTSIIASDISLRPVREYYIGSEPDDVYLLELPVKVRVRGRSPQLNDLLEQLSESHAWLPIGAVEIRKQPMRRLQSPDDSLEIVFEFSAFYPLKSQPEFERRTPGPQVPRGA